MDKLAGQQTKRQHLLPSYFQITGMSTQSRLRFLSCPEDETIKI
jgi:hypothetical protein